MEEQKPKPDDQVDDQVKTAIGRVKVDVLNAEILQTFAKALGDAIAESNDRTAAAISELAGAVEHLASDQKEIAESVARINSEFRNQTKTIARSVMSQRKRADDMVAAGEKVSSNAPDPSR